MPRRISSGAIGIAAFAISYASSTLGAPRWTGFVALAVGIVALLVFILSFVRWRCIKFTAGRVDYRYAMFAASGHGIRATGSLEAVVIPGSATSSRDLRFTTDKQVKRFIDTGERNPPPIGIRFQLPAEQIINHVPTDVRHCGRLILRVEEFHQHGIVIGDQLPGVDVSAEVSYQQRSEHHAVTDDRPISVRIDRSPRWHNFDHVAWILELHVVVTNQTDAEKEAQGYIWRGGDTAAIMSNVEVAREVGRRELALAQLRRHAILEPGAENSGWVVRAFPWNPEGSTPEFSFAVQIEGAEYEAAE